MAESVLPILFLSLFVPGIISKATQQAWDQYEGHVLLQVDVTNHGQWDKLLQAFKTKVAPNNESIGNLDVWHVKEGSNVVVMVTPTQLLSFEATIQETGIYSRVLIADMAPVIRRPAPRSSPKTRWGFHAYEDIVTWMDEMAKTHPHLVQVVDIGRSFEGRLIKVMRIQSAKAKRNRKPAIFLDAGAHAREWIGPAVAIYMIREMVENYNKHKEVVDSFEWFFLPVMNVDGYEYSRTHSRLWRKTRTNYMTKQTGCYGADPNRNFPFQWGTGKEALTKPCMDDYMGSKEASEPCVQSVVEFVKTMKQQHVKFVGYFTLHAFGQMWFVPYAAGTSQKPANIHDQLQVAHIGATAIEKVRGTKYLVGTPPSILYSASGSSMDWAYAAANIPYAFALELPPSQIEGASNGFLIPASQIIPVGEETFAGFKAATMAINAKLGGRVIHHKVPHPVGPQKVLPPGSLQVPQPGPLQVLHPGPNHGKKMRRRRKKARARSAAHRRLQKIIKPAPMQPHDS